MFPSPSLTPPTLEDFQWEYNGLVMGAGTPFGVLGVEGLDLAEIRSGDVNWPRDHGQAMGLDLYGGRDIIFDLWMKTDGTSLQAAQLELAAATVVGPNEEFPLWIQLPTLPILCVMCRPRKRKMKVDSDYAAAQVGKPELSLHATDPRIYGEGVETEIKPNHPSTTKTLDNTGNTEMRPIAVFTGPLARPTIKNKAIAGEPFLTISRAIPDAEEELGTRERTERSAKASRESAEAVALASRELGEAKALVKAEEAEHTAQKAKEEKEVKERVEAEEAEHTAKKAKEEAKETYISPREARETEEAVALAKRETKEASEKANRIASERNAKVKAENEELEAREKAEKEEAESKVAKVKAEKEAREVREANEKEGTHPTVKAGDQILVDLSTPHLAQYWVGGVGVGLPKNVLGWLTPTSTWWDLIPGNNPIQFSSYDAGATAGTVEIQWASADQL
jgi:hypothetical protein